MASNQDTATQRAAIYASTAGDSMESITDELARARNSAEENGLAVVGEYVDLRGEQAQLLQMMADTAASDPSFQKVVVSDLNHISQQEDELNDYRARLAANGVELVTVIEIRTKALVSAVMDYVRSEHADSVRRGIRAAAQQGFYVFAQAPYGYRKVTVWDNGVRRYKLELDPPASETARRIFDLRLEGATELEIAAELNASGATRRRSAGGKPNTYGASWATRSTAGPAWRRGGTWRTPTPPSGCPTPFRQSSAQRSSNGCN